MKILVELQRRNVIRMAGLYLVGAWLVTQVAATLLPVFEAPGWVMKALVALLAVGFLAALMFSWVFELTPDGLKRDGDVEVTESIAPQTRRRMDRMLLVGMALALGYFAVDKFVLAPSRLADSAPQLVTPTPANTGAATPAASPAQAALESKSIAVLAFADLSQGKDQEYFSDGVAEEILNALAKVKDLKVAGRTSSFYFKGRNEPLANIGSTLGVAHVLEGSVRKQGERLRISAKLLRISDGVQMWAETFDGTDADIFALQESIAQQVTTELKVALNAGAQGRLVDAGTNNPTAYALYLRATDVFNRRESGEFLNAIKLLQEAVALDPNFARAYSRLATLYYTVDAHVDAGRSVEQALRLDPKLAEPHAVLGAIENDQARYPQARVALEQALRLEPNDPTANFWHAIFFCRLGYIARCEKGLDRTLAIDPLLPTALAWRARLLVSSGDLPAAEKMSLRAREVGLSWAAMSTSWVAIARNDLAGARAETETLLAAFPADFSPAVKAFAGARVGDVKAQAQALRFIDQYLADNSPPIDGLVPLALVWSGEVERGLELFADGFSDPKAVFLSEVLGTRLYPQVWTSPAFPGFLRDTGIAAYWDEFGPPLYCAKNASGDYRCE